MAGTSSDYLAQYKQFFTEFAATVNPEDQLPVKVGGYCLCEPELTGEIVDWILQYLNQKNCPSSLIAPLTKIVVDDIRKAIKNQPAAYGYRREDNTYQPLKLMQVVTAKVNDVCLSYLDKPVDAFPPPTNCCLPASECAVKNTRRRMEDRHTIINNFHELFDVVAGGRATYYGVFDGHAGTDAAVYSASHLHQFLAESLHYPSEPVIAMREAFLKTDSLFLEKSTRDNLHSGTTALCALLRHDDRMLHVGWVGDSQAVLVTRGQPMQLVNPHKPARDDERKRIEDSGGCVMFWGMWRVNGQLAVSRAIGDVEYKPWVSAEPDIVSVPLTDQQDFLILACDGLWDFVSEREAIVSVYNTIRQHPGDLEAVSQHLVLLSKQQGSLDNISVIVVFLTDPAVLATLDVWPSCESEEEIMDDAIPAHTNGSSEPAYQKTNLLLELDAAADKLKQAGAAPPSATDLYFLNRPANGKEDDDDDFGPETDVDGVDDVLLSPAIAAAKAAALASDLEADLELQRHQMSAFDHVGEPREETPTPPADAVASGASLVPETDNVGESGDESEDEWNYYRVEPTDKPTEPTDTPVEVIEKSAEPVVNTEQQLEEDDNMESRLNPNAAEFVPSPTATTPSMEELLLSMSPRKAGIVMDDICVPSPDEFQLEVSQRPADGIQDIATNPFSDASFNSAFTDLGNVIQQDIENPYELLKNEPEFGELPELQNPFAIPEHVYTQSEVSSTNAECGDETDFQDISTSSFREDRLNLSMVEGRFMGDNILDTLEPASPEFLGFASSTIKDSDFVNNLLPSESSEVVASANNLFDTTSPSDFLNDFTSSEQDNTNIMPLSPTDHNLPSAPPPDNDFNILLPTSEVIANIHFDQQVNFSSPPLNELPLNEELNVLEEFESKVVAPFPDLVQEASIYSGMEHLDLGEFSNKPTEPAFEYSQPENVEAPNISVPIDFAEFETKSTQLASATTESSYIEDLVNAVPSDFIQDKSDMQGVVEPINETCKESSVEVESMFEDPALTAAAAAVLVGAATAATIAGAKNVKAEGETKAQEKKPTVDKTKPATKPIPGNRSTPVKTAIKSTPSSPTKPLSSPAPQAAPRISPQKKPTAAPPNRVASKTGPVPTKAGPTTTVTSKVASTTTSQARKVAAPSTTKPPATAAAKPTPPKTTTTLVRARPTATTSSKPLATEKKLALSNGDAKMVTKRPEPLVTKKLATTTTTTASKPLTRPASAPVASKTTKTTTVTRTTQLSTASAAKPAAKPAVNGVSKPKAAPLITASARPKTASSVTKTTLVDKQGKETANKQLSQTVKSSTVTRTTASSTAARKVAGNVTKTTSVTTTNSKAGGPIRRPVGTTVTKTTTTTTQLNDEPIESKIVVIQEITATVNKDDSPIVDNAHSEVLISTD